MSNSSFDGEEILGILDPQKRLKSLIKGCGTVLVNYDRPLKDYFTKLATPMLQIANQCYKNGELENAFAMYLKIKNLFMTAVRKHPDYSTISANMLSGQRYRMLQVEKLLKILRQEILKQYDIDYQIIYRKKKTAERRSTTSSKFECHYRSKLDAEPDPIKQIPKNVWTKSFKRISKLSSEIAWMTVGRKRSLVVPSKLLTVFHVIAKANILKNIRTGGVLCGEERQDPPYLVVTHVIIPKQTGSVNGFAFIDKDRSIDSFVECNNLVIIGWIMVQVKAEPFLNSKDLHRHLKYQERLPDAIVIACSGSHLKQEIFNLTKFGMSYLSGCEEEEFHFHRMKPSLYECSKHVLIQHSYPLTVLDLRQDVVKTCTY